MSIQIDIKFNKNWRTPILKSDGAKNVVWSTTTNLQKEANANAGGGDDFGRWVKMGDMGGGRWIGFVYARNEKAQAAQSENQALTRTLHT